MNAADLLLTEAEQREAVRSVRGDFDPLCRAQAAKVLAVLQGALSGTDVWYFIRGIITDTGLTWPPKEGFGTYGGVETLPPKEG